MGGASCSPSILIDFEGAALDQGGGTEALAYAVDRALGVGGAMLDEVGRVGLIRGRQGRNPEADKAERGAVDLRREKIASGGENPGGELGRIAQRTRPRAQLEIRGL